MQNRIPILGVVGIGAAVLVWQSCVLTAELERPQLLNVAELAKPRPQQLFTLINPKEAARQMQALRIVDTYKVDEKFAREVVDLAFKYEQDVFPKAKDILAVIAVESSFRSDVCSKLSTDPACGLMQVRPAVWGIKRQHLDTPNEQVLQGVRILSEYYDLLRNKDAAYQAYNLGITSYMKGKRNPEYVQKVYKAKKVLQVDPNAQKQYIAFQ